jgi:hypothetical protein
LTRRTFLERGEIPGLVLGALRGEATALRRILGARRAGRIGVACEAIALLVAAPWPAAIALAGLHAAIAASLSPLTRGAAGVSARESLRLAPWTAFPLLAVAAALRPAFPDSAAAAGIAVLVGSLLLWRGLARGLG